MAKSSNKLEWCLARIGEDMNWWVTEVSDPIHWDVDGLGIVDPRQISYILEQCDALREYGFDADIVDDAFCSFKKCISLYREFLTDWRTLYTPSVRYQNQVREATL